MCKFAQLVHLKLNIVKTFKKKLIMKKKIISIFAMITGKKTKKQIENEQIFNLFLKIKKTEKENPIIKYMDFKKESFFPKIEEIKIKNKGKQARNKSLEFLKKEFERIRKIYNEFSKSEERYFVLHDERKSMCFLKSSKDYNLLKYFAFNIFKNDIFVNVRKEYKKNISDCIISSNIDEKLLKQLKLNEKLNQKSYGHWGFVGHEIKNKIDIKITLTQLKKDLTFLTISNVFVN